MSRSGDVTRSFIAARSSSADLSDVAASLRATPAVQNVTERNDLGLLQVTFTPEANAAEIAAIQHQYQLKFPDLSFEPNAELHYFDVQ
jgi:hypothetical protein